MEPHPNTIKRSQQEQEGGWLPLYIEAERSVVDGRTLRCFYCGFGYGTGHDDACRYIGADVPALEEDEDRIILVPKGGLPPSNSFF